MNCPELRPGLYIYSLIRLEDRERLCSSAVEHQGQKHQIGISRCCLYMQASDLAPAWLFCEQEGWRGRSVCVAYVQFLSLGSGAASRAAVACAGWPLDRVLGWRLQRAWLLGLQPTVHDQLTRAGSGGGKGDGWKACTSGNHTVMQAANPGSCLISSRQIMAVCKSYHTCQTIVQFAAPSYWCAALVCAGNLPFMQDLETRAPSMLWLLTAAKSFLCWWLGTSCGADRTCGMFKQGS